MTPLKVLILEDQPDDADLVLRELRKAGYDLQYEQVETEEAFRSQLSNPPDVILADYYLPRYDALRALRHLKEIGLDVPFIVVTGAVGEEKAVDCIKEGATDYLPFKRLTGLQTEDVLGKQIAEALPSIDSASIGVLHRVATTGKPARFEQFVPGLNKHLEVTAFSPKPDRLKQPLPSAEQEAGRKERK